MEPIKAKEGQYFGVPVYDHGKLQILMVDFFPIWCYNEKDNVAEMYPETSEEIILNFEKWFVQLFRHLFHNNIKIRRPKICTRVFQWSLLAEH
ncbi:MAG: hypothetical protein ACOCNL_13115 [Acetivibrio ethanolgignens]